MIGEPEPPGEEPQWGPGPDELTGGQERAPTGRWTRGRPLGRPLGRLGGEWRRTGAGAVAGALVASAVWGLVLRGTHDGHGWASGPQGHHLDANLCAGDHLQPLAGRLGEPGLSGTAEIRTGPALDHLACDMLAPASVGSGWATDYHVTLTVDLHKKTDPRAEFADTYGRAVSYTAPLAGEDTAALVASGDGPAVTSYPGLGDLAFLSVSTDEQSLRVLRGGTVLTLTVNATDTTWQGPGAQPPASRATPRPRLRDQTTLPGTLARTLTRLLTTLTG